jgi:AcrR family transcriptional regulator
MAARAGISRDDVIATAIAMLDEGQAPDAVTLGALARRLGIRPQSLYAHVDGSAGLERAVAAAGLYELAEVVIGASIGVDGIDAVAAIVQAHLSFAQNRPTLYEAALHPAENDPELQAAIDAVGRPLEIVLASCGLDETARIHWTRLFVSSVYGFVVLHRTARLTLPVAVDDTAKQLVAMLTSQLQLSLR